MEEDTRQFLSRIDAATERVFEACSEIMAAESSEIVVACSKEKAQDNLSIKQKDLSSQLSPKTTISSPSVDSNSSDEPQNKRKRLRTSSIFSRKSNLGADEKSPSATWSEILSTQSHIGSNSMERLSKEPLNLVKKSDDLLRNKTAFGIERNVTNSGLEFPATLPPLASNVGNQREDIEKVDGFSKEIHDAVIRIESLIPSLQKLVTCTDTSKREEFNGTNNSGNQARIDKPPNWLLTRNESRVKGKNIMDYSLSSALRELDLKKNLHTQVANQVPVTKLRDPMNRVESLKSTWSRNESVPGHTPEHIQGLRNMPCQSYNGSPMGNWTSGKEAIAKPATSRPQTVIPSEGTSSFTWPNRTKNIGRCKYSQNRRRRSVASQKMKSRYPINRNSVIRKKHNGALQGKIILHSQSSEETGMDRRSAASSSGRNTLQHGYPSSSSGTYQSTDFYDNESDGSDQDYGKVCQQPRRKWSSASESSPGCGTSSKDNLSDESDQEYEKVCQPPRTKPSLASESNPGYDTSSYYSSQDQYSDASPSSRRSSFRHHKGELRLEKEKVPEKFSRLRKKIGMIFHHHHHHHHHYSDWDESDVVHDRLWKRIGNHTGKSNHKKPKYEKLQKPMSSTVVRKKQQGGYFHALMNGLMRHINPSKKSKQIKDGIGKLDSVRHGDKRATKRLPGWPKLHGGRGSVKVSDKGKAKLGARRIGPQLALAKMILKH